MTSELKTERVPFMAPPSLVATLDAAAKQRGITRSELIRQRLEDDSAIVEWAQRWQSQQADVVEQRADTRPAYDELPNRPRVRFAGHVHQAEYVETTDISPELAAAINPALNPDLNSGMTTIATNAHDESLAASASFARLHSGDYLREQKERDLRQERASRFAVINRF